MIHYIVEKYFNKNNGKSDASKAKNIGKAFTIARILCHAIAFGIGLFIICYSIAFTQSNWMRLLITIGTPYYLLLLSNQIIHFLFNAKEEQEQRYYSTRLPNGRWY